MKSNRIVGPQKGASASLNEAAASKAVDSTVQGVLRAAREKGTTQPAVTEKSIRERNAFMEKARRDDMATVLDRIAQEELLTEDELREKLGVNHRWIPEAVAMNRLFYLRAPSGENVYPAFYGATAIKRQWLEEVCQLLQNLPGPVKYCEFSALRGHFAVGVKAPLHRRRNGATWSSALRRAPLRHRFRGSNFH